MSSVSSEILDLERDHIKSWIWSLSFLCRRISINCTSHRLENPDSSRPESLSSGLSGFRTSDARRVRRLMISCSVDGMKPADRAFCALD